MLHRQTASIAILKGEHCLDKVAKQAEKDLLALVGCTTIVHGVDASGRTVGTELDGRGRSVAVFVIVVYIVHKKRTDRND